MRKIFSLIAAVLFAGSMMADNFVPVTDASTLADGDQIIITDVDAATAISTLQKSNNRGVTTVALTDGVIVPGENVQIITLVAAEANFMLQVGEDAYLYAASNSSNYLKTANAETVGDNGKFAISITEGVASVIAQGTNSRNDLRYNPSASCFSCYASTTSVEAGLKIFKKDGGVVPPTPAVAAPVIAGEVEFTETTEATITCATEGAVIYYTLDGTEPTSESAVYSAPITLSETTTVKAIAAAGEDLSAVVEKTFTKVEPLPEPTDCATAAAAALSVSANNELYNNGAVYTIEGYVTSIKTAYSDQYHNISFWMADTQDGGEVIQAYRAVCASEADAPAVGDKVAVTGSLTKYNTTPEFAAGCTYVIAPAPIVGVETIYDWAANIGTTIFGGNSNITTGTVKIHENTDEVNGIKFGSSYVYADGKYIAIKPAEGGFQAGDEISLSVVFNNSDVTKYCMVDLRAADGDTRIWMSDSLSTLNGRNAGDPVVQTYTLEADQDSLFLGRYGNTGMFVTLLKVTRALVPPTPQPTVNYYVAGSMNEWGPAEAYMLTPNNESLYEGEFTFAANDEFKVIGFDGTNTTWYPGGMGNNFQITEAGDYKITFNPAGNVEGWYEGYFNVIMKEEPIAPTTCAEAAEAALSVENNNDLYNDGAVYTIEGYVTSIKTAYSDQYHNISFWMADTRDGGEVLQAYRAVCASEADAPAVGDKVAVTGSLTKYNTTPEFAAGCTFVITERAPIIGGPKYYVAGSMNNWGPSEAYELVATENDGEYAGEFTFAANDEFKVIGLEGDVTTWYPGGMGNNFQITEAGDYKIFFRPAGNVEGWYEGFFNVIMKETPIVPQYEVAEAIAAGLQENDEVLVRGVITKMEFKGKNFAKYGSVNVYVADATGAEGEFEFFNCYSLNADTFRTSIPNYDPESASWAQFNEVADENGNAIHVGDTVIAFGKYKLYNTTHELNQGCYLVDIKHAPVAPADTIALEFNTENTTYAYVDNQYFSDYGTTDIYLSDININTSTYQFEGDGNYLVLDFYPENANNVTGVYQAQDETLDLEYTYLLTINGTDTAFVEFADGAIQVEIGEVDKEHGLAQLAVGGMLMSTDGDIYTVMALVIAYYDFLPEEGVENVVLDPKAIKRFENGSIVIEKNGKAYNINGAQIR